MDAQPDDEGVLELHAAVGRSQEELLGDDVGPTVPFSLGQILVRPQE